MKKFVFISILCLCQLALTPLRATETADEPVASAVLLKAAADSAYMAADYEAAVRLYDSLMTLEGQSVEALYNMAGAYLKMDEIAQAVLNYERALLLSPGDDDVRFNLEFARSQTIDRIVPHHEIFLVTWWRSLVSMQGADTWALIAALCFVALLICVLAFLFTPRLWQQKTAFYLSLTLLAACLLFNVCAWQQATAASRRAGAVVMTSSAVVRSTPAEGGTELFVVHEGTRVDITDDTMQMWKEIVLADGKKGWIEAAKIEII